MTRAGRVAGPDQGFLEEGNHLHLNAPVQQDWQEGTVIIHLVAGGEEVKGDSLLVPVGRRPNVRGLGLENAGVGAGPAPCTRYPGLSRCLARLLLTQPVVR